LQNISRKSRITIDINGQLQRRLVTVIALLQTYLFGHARKKISLLHHHTIKLLME